MDELVRVMRGVHRPPSHVDDLPGRCAAVLSALPPGAVVSGPSAAAIHGMWMPRRPTTRIEISVPANGAAPRDLPSCSRPEIRLRRRSMAPDEISRRGGIRVTTVARTWLDLCASLALPDLVAAGDWALREGVTEEELTMLVKRGRGRRGARAAARCRPLLDGRSASRMESHLRAAVVLAGLPAPAVNADVFDRHGGWLARPDLSWAEHRLALEYYGEDHAEVRRMRKDITRTLELQRLGWTVLIFGPVEVLRRPDEISLLVQDHLRRTAARQR